MSNRIRRKQSAPAEFELRDDYGDVHSYTVMKHPARDGWRLALRLLRVLGKPLGMSFEGLSPMAIRSALAQMGAAVKEMAAPDESTGVIEFSPIGEAISHLAMELINHPELIGDLLEHTYRDNQELRDPGVFDIAFQANYGELMMVMKEVAMVNYGPSFSRGSGTLSNPLGRLSKERQTETRAPSSKSSSHQD